MTDNWHAKVVAPPEIVVQLDQFLESLYENEGENLIGVYLHGSLAMGCFQPGGSDLDLLVLVDQPPSRRQCRTWAQQMLHHSAAPAGIEISMLDRAQFTPWRYPTPYAFHYSEEWRPKMHAALADEHYQAWGSNDIGDPDLAGHFTVTHRRGVCLAGVPFASAASEVPWADYLDSILRDFDWACVRAADNPVYLVLNACRTWAAVAEALVLSKAEGAVWAQGRLPAELAAIVAQAADVYRGAPPAGAHAPLSGHAALELARWIAPHLR
jgi:streptomycin 3"-adenylyltransferase